VPKERIVMKSVINFYDSAHKKFVIWKESHYTMRHVATGYPYGSLQPEDSKYDYGITLHESWVTIEELEFLLDAAKQKINDLRNTKGFTGFDF